MLDDPPILKIRRQQRQPTDRQIIAFKNAMTGNVVDCMDGRGAMDHRIKPLDASIATVCGPALTCFAYPADNLGVLAALHISRPGDIIVCANDSYSETATIGDLVCGMMKNKGVAGYVTDGMVRDQEGIRPWELPIFCKGVTPNSPARTGPGSVGLPITIGGITVETGDMIVCDRDGVVAIPFDVIDSVISKLEPLRKAETSVESLVKSGMCEPDYIADLISSNKTHFVE
ncbi:MAG: aldolase [Rhodospirillaceae bacterium]|nr:aldolase [Rhodospirillaceae bacterium]|tara:strand:- start:742 stop:1431 length:690 start_codon:yes stop_codon:yes gene_type:complete